MDMLCVGGGTLSFHSSTFSVSHRAAQKMTGPWGLKPVPWPLQSVMTLPFLLSSIFQISSIYSALTLGESHHCILCRWGVLHLRRITRCLACKVPWCSPKGVQVLHLPHREWHIFWLVFGIAFPFMPLQLPLTLPKPQILNNLPERKRPFPVIPSCFQMSWGRITHHLKHHHLQNVESANAHFSSTS